MSVCYGGQIVGARDNQEDAFRVIRQSDHDDASDILILLADGMGGHTSGEVAAQTAIDAFERHFIAATHLARPEERLNAALQAANQALLDELRRSPERRGMGCTFIGAIKVGQRLYWVSVGDSLLYLLRRGKLVRLNADHSVRGELMEQVAAGRISEEEARAHPRGNALRSALTGNKIALIDLNSTELEPGDSVLVASDGLETLTEAQIAATWGQSRRGPQRTVDALLSGVEKQADPRQDNTTIVAYDFQSSSFGSSAPDTKWVLSARSGVRSLRVLFPVLAVGLVAIAGVVWSLWQSPASPDQPATGSVQGPAAKPLPGASGTIGTVSPAKTTDAAVPSVTPLPAGAPPSSGTAPRDAGTPAAKTKGSETKNAVRKTGPAAAAGCPTDGNTSPGDSSCLAPTLSPAPQTRP